jgi:hypothetical protein
MMWVILAIGLMISAMAYYRTVHDSKRPTKAIDPIQIPIAGGSVTIKYEGVAVRPNGRIGISVKFKAPRGAESRVELEVSKNGTHAVSLISVESLVSPRHAKGYLESKGRICDAIDVSPGDALSIRPILYVDGVSYRAASSFYVPVTNLVKHTNCVIGPGAWLLPAIILIALAACRERGTD